MKNLKLSWNYFPYEDLPEIDSSVPFREVYEKLSKEGHGGFLLVEGGHLKKYVKAYTLAKQILTKLDKNAAETRRLADTPIGQVIAEVPKLSDGPVVPVEPNPIDVKKDESDLEEETERVYRVIESERLTGWYLNNETVRKTLTQKTVFICANGHENLDFDNGTCYYCPAPIVEIRRND
jgi:hypothetical protein